MSHVSQAAPRLWQLTPQASLLLVAAAGAWVGVVLVAGDMGAMPGTVGAIGVAALVLAVAVVFEPGLAPGLHYAASAGRMGGM